MESLSYPWQRISFLSLVKNCNHKGLGIYYLLSAFIFGISGTLISVLIRIELYSSGNRIISPENQNFYNISITLHGFLMIFFLVMPGLFGGFGNYFVPIFQGSPEVVYPRVNNFSILILLLSYLFLILSLISDKIFQGQQKCRIHYLIYFYLHLLLLYEKCFNVILFNSLYLQ
jgi:heme/copper-type cytochrome/quinol oxidase subunit 1